MAVDEVAFPKNVKRFLHHARRRMAATPHQSRFTRQLPLQGEAFYAAGVSTTGAAGRVVVPDIGIRPETLLHIKTLR